MQEEGLRTYIYAHAAFFSTISLASLAETFELPVQAVAAVAGSMIWQDQLAGSLDVTGPAAATGGMLYLHSSSRSPLQQMAVALADKASQMLFENERTATAKLGDGGPSDGRQSGGAEGTRGDRGERRGGRGGRSDRGGGGRGRGSSNFSGAIGAPLRA